MHASFARHLKLKRMSLEIQGKITGEWENDRISFWQSSLYSILTDLPSLSLASRSKNRLRRYCQVNNVEAVRDMKRPRQGVVSTDIYYKQHHFLIIINNAHLLLVYSNMDSITPSRKILSVAYSFIFTHKRSG